MKTPLGNFALFAVLSCAVFSASAIATPIIIAGNTPQSDENVLLDSDASGAVIQGTLNQSGGIVNFSSESGDLLSPSSGQARIEAADGNDPFTNLTFWLSDGATFTSAIFNINGDSGTVDISVSYLLDGGTPSVFTFETGNGSNFFTVLGGDSLLTQITLSTANGSFNDLRQIRIGGYAQPPVVVVPDKGRSIVFVSLGLLMLAGLHRFAPWRSGVLGIYRG